MTNISRKCKAIWNILNQHDMESLVVGWWPSHPAEPINGVMVSDYYHKAPKKPGDPWNLLPKAVHPSNLFSELSELRVHPMEIGVEHLIPFVPHGAEIDQESDGRLSMVMKVLAECTSIHSAATHLLENESWDFAAIYYDAIDHFSHGFMRYHPPQQENVSDKDFRLYQNVVNAGYIYHDMCLARLMELKGEDTTVILMSDHGFHPDHLRPKHIPSEPAGPAAEHRDYGIFVASGPGIKKDHIVHGANLLDVTPTILRIYDLPVGEDMDGNSLDDIFETVPEDKTIPSWEDVDGDDGQHPEDLVIDAAESKEALDQLVALGYIDPPDENSEKAIEDCERELDYNLARAYMDAAMHGEAMPMLLKLYNGHPLEFRFGIQLANCLRAMDRTEDLQRLVDDLNARWRLASAEARERIRDIAKIAKKRKENWLEMKKIDEANKDDPSNPPRLARVSPSGKPELFADGESHIIRKLKSVARGNPRTLDFLNATIAASKNDFESALDYLEKAKLTKSKNSSFQFHVGNVYLGLGRLKDAEEAYGNVLEFDELNSNALMGLCRTYLEMGKNAKALEVGRQAIGLRFHFPVAHFYYGNARFSAGDIEGAIASFNTAIEQNPNFQQAHEALAKIYSTSNLDEELSRYHASAAENLTVENEAFAESFEPIELVEIDPDELKKQIPKITMEGNSDVFLRCLAQPKSGSVDANEKRAQIVIVSGLPRSGTSVMMQMLVAGGVEAFTDENRVPDENNPRGYYEADVVKKLTVRNNWLEECDGKVVKVVAQLIPYLPQQHDYKVIFMDRELTEILSSQQTMLDRLEAEGGNIDQERLKSVFERQTKFANSLLEFHQYPVQKIGFRDVIADPQSVAKQIEGFLGRQMDVAAMVSAVDPKLYREKSGK